MSEGPIIPPEEFSARRARAAAAAKNRGLDGLIAWGRGGALDGFSDVHYFTNHFSPGVWVPPLPSGLTGCEQAGLIITGGGEASLLVSDFCSEEAAIDDVRRNWDLRAELLAAVRDHGISQGRVGVIGWEVLPFSFGDALRDEFPRIRLEAADDLSAELRSSLSDAEIAMMRRAGHVGVRIYEALVAAVQPGATEGEAIGAALSEAARIPGCAHWNFLAASGPHASRLMRTSLPSWSPSQRYEVGDVVHMDCYGYYRGYSYDLARTIIVGGDEAENQRLVVEGVRAACDAMASALEPGITPRELHAEASATLRDAALEPLAPGFGHGIGAGFFRPYLLPVGPDLDLPLKPRLGMAFEVLAKDAKGVTAYHEDNYVLLDGGVLCVTAPSSTDAPG